MTGLTALWLPILLSSVTVFIASSFIHMASPWHKNDFPMLPTQDSVMDALRPLAIPPGDYFVPRPATRADLKSPEFAEKMKKGPVLVMTVMPNGPIAMGSNLVLWFLYSVAIGVFAAFIAGRALAPGAAYRQVFKFSGVTAFVGYSAALWQMSIWYKRAWTITVKATVDGIFYAALTAGVFGWLWPH